METGAQEKERGAYARAAMVTYASWQEEKGIFWVQALEIYDAGAETSYT